MCALSQFPSYTNLCGVFNILKGIDVIRRNLEKWLCANLLRLNKAKSKVMGWDNPKNKYRMSTELTEDGSEEKHFRVLVVESFNVTWQCALNCIKRNMARRSREVILPAFIKCCI